MNNQIHYEVLNETTISNYKGGADELLEWIRNMCLRIHAKLMSRGTLIKHFTSHANPTK